MMPLARMLDVGVGARDNRVGKSGGVDALILVILLAQIGQGALPRVLLVNIVQTLFVFGVQLARFVLVHNQSADCVLLDSILRVDKVHVRFVLLEQRAL
jgi:hypothetical protein